MRLNESVRSTLAKRLVEAAREIGVLLLAFAPLEFTLQGGASRPIAMAVFIASGFGLWAGSLYGEVRQQR